jgi:hypothetical protein
MVVIVVTIVIASMIVDIVEVIMVGRGILCSGSGDGPKKCRVLLPYTIRTQLLGTSAGLISHVLLVLVVKALYKLESIYIQLIFEHVSNIAPIKFFAVYYRCLHTYKERKRRNHQSY